MWDVTTLLFGHYIEQVLSGLGVRWAVQTMIHIYSLTSMSAKLFEHFIEHYWASGYFLWPSGRSLGKITFAEL
jgi:hypothetical protein